MLENQLENSVYRIYKASRIAERWYLQEFLGASWSCKVFTSYAAKKRDLRVILILDLASIKRCTSNLDAWFLLD